MVQVVESEQERMNERSDNETPLAENFKRFTRTTCSNKCSFSVACETTLLSYTTVTLAF